MITRRRHLLRLATMLAGIASVPAMAQNLVCEAPSQAADAAPLTGHYYLSGMREVGSELLLKPDGSFQWMLAYGTTDHTAKGRWWRNGDCIGLANEQGSRVPFELLRRDGDEMARATYADMDKYPVKDLGDRLLVYAVEVSRGMSSSGLEVALRWDDGVVRTAIAERQAAFFVPRDSTPVAVGARWPQTGMAMTWMPVEKGMRWPVLLRLNINALPSNDVSGNTPVLPTSLRIDADGLIPTWPWDGQERGRYQRE